MHMLVLTELNQPHIHASYAAASTAKQHLMLPESHGLSQRSRFFGAATNRTNDSIESTGSQGNKQGLKLQIAGNKNKTQSHQNRVDNHGQEKTRLQLIYPIGQPSKLNPIADRTHTHRKSQEKEKYDQLHQQSKPKQ